VWFKEDLWDREFADKWIEPEGLGQWRSYVMGADDGIDKTPSWAERICGVPADTISGFARLYAKSKPVNLNVPATMGRQCYGENPTRAAMYLQALTGNTCIQGGTAAAETFHWVGRPTVNKPSVDWRQKPGPYKPPVLLISYKWTKAIDLRDKFDRGTITRDQYCDAIGCVPGAELPNIQMVILESNNYLLTIPDINANIRALKKAGSVVVFSHYADMPSARYADILLPQMATAFEGRDTGWLRRGNDLFQIGRNLGNYFTYRQKILDAPGEVKSAEWVWVQIARRLGFADMYSPRLASVSDDKWDEVIEDLHREAYEKWAVTKEMAPLHPPTWEEFQKKPVFRWESKDPYYAFKEDIERGSNPFRKTESGRINFYSKMLAKGPAYLAANEFEPGSGKCYGGGNLPPMAQMTLGGRDSFHSKETERYPLLMSSPHSIFRMHSFLDNQPLLNQDCYRHAIWMNVSDARSRGIVDGALVRAYNDIGEITLPTYVTSRIVPGAVCIFHGAWYTPGPTKNELMPEGIDTRGAPNLLIHNVDLPDTIVGNFPCKGLIQVELLEEK
jgi:anaerobic dimethyl sulfoxide reductase subunit A